MLGPLRKANFRSTFLLLLGLSSGCSADIVYSNINAPLNGGGQAVLGATVGQIFGVNREQVASQLFEADENANLTDVIVGVSNSGQDQPGFSSVAPAGFIFSNLFNVWLYSAVGYTSCDFEKHECFEGYALGSPIAELEQNLTAPDNPSLITAYPTNPISLDAQSFYWIILTPSDPDTLLTWNQVDGSANSSLTVEGSVPEPSTMTLAIVALLGIARLLAARRLCGRNCWSL